MPPPPFEYILLTYSRDMRLSYAEALHTPADVVMRHLEIMRLEAQYGPPKAKVG